MNRPTKLLIASLFMYMVSPNRLSAYEIVQAPYRVIGPQPIQIEKEEPQNELWELPDSIHDLIDDGVYRPDDHGAQESLEQDAYVYQVQTRKSVNWLYIGLAPRMEDPSRVKVVFSKKGKTMRVSMSLTRREVANYPAYLVRRASEVEKIIAARGVQLYQPWRLQAYYDEVDRIRRKYKVQLDYNDSQFKRGLRALKELFPSNIFMAARAGEGPDVPAVKAHFVYPITVHRNGSWPAAKNYSPEQAFASPEGAIEERRSKYTGGKKKNYKNRHDFGGFPAIWLDSLGAGTGVHGPIRFSRLVESKNSEQVAPYGNEPNNKWRFWRENEFRGMNVSDGLKTVRLRWDVVRTKQSNGCFRAETMELRNILPSSQSDIARRVKFTVIDEVDSLNTANGKKFVDVNYYLTDPYSFSMDRRDWIKREIGGDVEKFIQNSMQFEYLDPATLEFTIDGSAQAGVMGEFNQAGGSVSL